MQEEIKKHTKKIFRAMKQEENTFVEKIKEIAIEVGIIVFAITLSIWLHSWSQHNHQQEEVRQFLEGLKSDLQATVTSAEHAKEIYKRAETRFHYLSALKKDSKPDADSLNAFFQEYNTSPNFQSNASRYEGFKSSGKIGFIEHEVLQQGVLNFYQQDLPTYYTATNAWNNYRYDLQDFVIEHYVENEDGTNNTLQILTHPKAHNLCKSLIPWPQLYERNETIIKNANLLIAAIDKEIGE